MQVRKGSLTVWGGSLGVLLLATSTAAQQPVFRANAVLVPVDVRVVDRNGQPVIDLTASDFVVTEDGIEREVSLFTNYSQPNHQVVGSERVLHTGAPADGRTFVVLLGRGRLNGPSRGLEAVADFIQHKLSPRDRVAVVAYDRVTELTMDRPSILRFIDAYGKAHEDIEARLAHFFSGPTDGDEPPSSIQHKIDRLFAVPGIPRTAYLRDVASAPNWAEAERWFETGLRLQTAPPSAPGQLANPIAELIYRAEVLRDVDKVRAVLGYLKTLPGEKHLIAVAEEGPDLSADIVQRLAMVAADARVSVWPIQVGGLEFGPPITPTFKGFPMKQLWRNTASRTFAELTGGRASYYQYAAKATDVLELTTRHGYLLGYYPPARKNDDRPRRIEVRAKRRNVRLLYRRGYFAGSDDRENGSYMDALRDSQIANALAFRLTVNDIPLQVSATPGEKKSGRETVHVQVAVDPSRVRFTEKDGRRTAALEVAIVVTDVARRGIGETRKRVDLKLLPATSERLMRDGVAFSADVEITGKAASVKTVVYDLAQGRLGSAVAPVAR